MSRPGVDRSTARRPTIGVAVIARDEADRLGGLLESVSFADEVVVVVDPRSRDGTAELAERWGAKVIENRWPGFVAQKQLAMDSVGTDWVLCLDADEEVSEALAAEIREAVESAAPGLQGFSMPRRSRYLGRWIRHGGWSPDRSLRLARSGCGRWRGGALHERLTVDGEVTRLESPILHHVYRGISDQVSTIDRYSDLAASERGSRGGLYVVLGVLHAVVKFFECAVWKLGLLDGIPGLVIAMNSSWYVFLKHAKAWEAGLAQEDDRPGD